MFFNSSKLGKRFQLAQMAMKNKTVLKTLVLPGFKNDQRKFLEGFAKLFLTLFFCNEQLD
jgi:hypothetical protein